MNKTWIEALGIFGVMIGIAALIIAASAMHAKALDNVSIPYRFNAGDTIKSARIMGNYDSIVAKTNRIKDSVSIKFLRSSTFLDSNWSRIKTDSIRSNPNIDSISGNTWFSGTVRADSLWVNKGIVTNNKNVSTGTGDVHTDSVSARAVNIGDVTADSIYGRIIKLSAGIEAAGNISGLRFDGTDTIATTKGIRGTNGNFSGTIAADSVYSTKGIKALSFTGNFVSDSIYSRAIRSDRISLSPNIVDGDTGYICTDSLRTRTINTLAAFIPRRFTTKGLMDSAQVEVGGSVSSGSEILRVIARSYNATDSLNTISIDGAYYPHAITLMLAHTDNKVRVVDKVLGVGATRNLAVKDSACFLSTKGDNISFVLNPNDSTWYETSRFVQP